MFILIPELKKVDKELEDQANKFAAECLIPGSEYNSFAVNSKFADIRSLKRWLKNMVTSGIVVGRL